MAGTKLIVVSGPPGAGKSSVAAALAERFDPGALVTGDDFFAMLRRGAVAPWLAEAGPQNLSVIEAAAAAAGRLARHCTVVYDGVVGPWFRADFDRAAGVDGLHVVLRPPLSVCLDRIRTRTGHDFTDVEAATHMWHEFAGVDDAITRTDLSAADLADWIAGRLGV